jgi:amino acid adenylation domain-containing protein/thioester reductase-like protein
MNARADRIDVAERLARLSPEQRALLLRRLAPARAPVPAPDDAIPVRAVASGQALPLSPVQQRLWLNERLTPGRGAQHVYGHYRLRGVLDRAALARAFAELVRRHDALRLSFGEVEGAPCQRVAADVRFALAEQDLSELPAGERAARAFALADLETERAFDLRCAPLLRATLLRLERDDHVLLVVLHHLVADAWSRGVLYAELAQLYAAYAAGRAPALSEPVLGYADVAWWQAQPAQLARAEAQIGFWQQALDGTPGVLDLPVDRPRADAAGGRGARERVSLPHALVDPFLELARREGATPFMALLAAFQALLSRWSGQDDLVVGTPVANRGRPELAGVVGLLVNTVALRAELGDDPSFRTLLQRTRRHALDALDHAEAPLERVIERLRLERVPGRAPLLQTMFVLQNADDGAPPLPGLALEWIEPDARSARFELTLALGATALGYEGVVDYDRDLYDAATIARFVRHYAALLRSAAAWPDRPLSQLALLDDGERRELLALGDGGPAPRPQAATLHALFAAQAARTPDAIALVEPGRALSYAALLRRVQGVAQALRARGVGPEARVALLADRSADAIIGVLGVLAAGAAYVPLDPGQPDQRLLDLLADAEAQLLLVPAAQLARAQALAAAVAIIAIAVVPDSDLAASADARPEHAAYVIYTSGSTGKPKGVVIEQRGALNLVLGFLARHDFRGQRLLMIPPLIFDASVGDLFPVLAGGATLVLHPNPTELGPQELQRYCHEHAVTAIDAPAALWRRWSEGWAAAPRPSSPLPALRLMMIGGESVPLEQVRRFAAVTGGGVDLVNHYGPTEASVCATLLPTRDGRELATLELPIGRPLPGVRVYVLDRHGALAPRGMVGELAIGGAGVARGYLGDRPASAAAFVPDPYATQPGARMYRTGDLARWNADGTLQFLGRRDQQTKLRGWRIELGEIEAALATHAGVRAAAVIVREDRPGDRRLVAYVVTDAGIGAEALRAHLAARLPEAMLPAAFVPLDALPLTRNGKVDRRALPAPAQALPPRTTRAPSTATEQGVLEVWRELLGRDDLGVDDDFFAVGGDSLSTLPLVYRLHARFGVELPLAAVFAAPTAALLARQIEQREAGAVPAEIDLDARAVLDDDIDPRAAVPAGPRATPRSVLVTGATGFLGAYLVRELLDLTGAEILCLVRAGSDAEGLARVRANLDGYGLLRPGDAARLVPVRGDLALPRLGLDAEAFAALAARADAIFHNGGQVNFIAPYEHLEAANVAGTRDVLRLAATTRVKPVHLVSTLGVYLTADHLERTVRESDPAPRGASQHGGYNQSKWVGEQLALRARARGVPVAIYRPARITGDSRSGRSNLGDYLNAWIKGCVQLGLAPLLPDEAFDMAPVDYVGRSIVRIALGAGAADGQFHFHNARRLPIADAVAVLREAGHALDEVEYPAWRRALLAAVAAGADNALKPFAGLFPVEPDPREPVFDCRASEAAVAPFGLVCPPADRAMFARYVAFLTERGFLPRRGSEVGP